MIAGAAAGVSAPVSTLHTCAWSRSRSVLAPPGFMRTVPILSSTRNGCLQDRTQASRGARGRTRACGGVARLLAPCPSRKTTVNYARSTALCLTITEASDQVPWPFAYFLSYCAKYIARRRREERKDVVPRRGRPADCGWSTCSPHLQHVVPYTDGPDAASGAKVPYATLAASQIHATGGECPLDFRLTTDTRGNSTGNAPWQPSAGLVLSKRASTTRVFTRMSAAGIW